jgi:hypothetical protein
MGLIYSVFLQHRLVRQSEALPCPKRGGVSAAEAEAEATSAGVDIVDYFISICIYYVLTCRVLYNYAWSFSPSCLWVGVSRLCVQTQATESADCRNIMPRPPAGIPLHFPDPWAVRIYSNLPYRSPPSRCIKAGRARDGVMMAVLMI